MRRSSFVGPILLIVIGTLFLLRNMLPDLHVLNFLSMYWPYLLIAWGFLRLVEVLTWSRTGRPLPRSGISGGEWGLIVLICVLGTVFFWGMKRRPWLHSQISAGAWELMGESYQYPLSETAKLERISRVIIDNARGNVHVVGGDLPEVRVTGAKSIKALNRAEADRNNQQSPFELLPQGDTFLIRTNLDRMGPGFRVKADLDVIVPRTASVEVRSRQGDVQMENVNGNVEISSENAGVRLHDIGGDVRTDIRRSDLIQIINAGGMVSVKGRGQDLELANIGGVVTVNGNYAGDLSFQKLAKGLRLESVRTNFRVAQLPGAIRFSMGKITGDQLTGPLTLQGRSQDVELSEFSDSVEIDIHRGDVILRPARTPLGKIGVKTHSGEIDLAVPPNASFDLAAKVQRGEIENDFGLPLTIQAQGRGHTLEGKVGTGPRLTLETERGQIRVRKTSSAGVSSAPAIPSRPRIPPSPIVQ